MKTVVFPTDTELAVTASEIMKALNRARSAGVVPVKVLCPFRELSWISGNSLDSRHKISAKEVFGVELGLGSELVALTGDGSMSVWEDREA